jgi:hypothetical protein
MQSDRRLILTTGGLAILCFTAAGAPRVRHKISSHHVRPKVVCDIPAYDYLSTNPAAPALAISQTAVLLRSPTLEPGLPAVPGATVSYFLLAEPSLVNGHCSISNVALLIRDDGFWSLSLRADQNPVSSVTGLPLIAVSPSPPRVLLPGATLPSQFTDHIKRNQFIIRVRGYGAYRDLTDAASFTGHPVLFTLEVPPFWVERALPLIPPPFQGKNAQVADYFKNVDRVEVELTYR